MKIRRISQFQKEITFPGLDNHFQDYLNSFYDSDLGSIYRAIPWQGLVKQFGLKDYKKGPGSLFSPRGKVALMFLKHYACCSDKKLIEQLSFDAFNEGIRLKKTAYTAQQLTRTKLKVIGADAIYANNANRRWVTAQGIKTDFKRKEKPSKDQHHFKQLARMISKERASAMEGSFGTDKEHFLLNRIRARTKKTETLWIFLGIHTSNALKIGRRMSQTAVKAA